ncbi:MAG: hypothetical protein AAFP84_21760 [Actinomycetota bacterium]
MGDFPINFVIGGNAAPFGLSPTSGTLGGGQSVAITASIDRSDLPEGGQTATLQISGDGTSRGLTLRAAVERPPVISSIDTLNAFCSSTIEIPVNAQISDESGVASAAATATGPGGTASTALTPAAGASGWFGFMSILFDVSNPPAASGTYTVTVTASDTRGNTGSRSTSINIQC